MSKYLLNLHFDKTGCNNTDIINMGGVSFEDTSSIIHGSTCAYFKGYDRSAGLILKDTSKIKSHINGNNDFTLYCKYKIDKKNLNKDTKIPLFSFKNNDKFESYVYIENAEYFVVRLSETEKFYSSVCDFTFNNKWHYFTITKDENIFRIFVDGCNVTSNNITKDIKFGDELYIGYGEDNLGNVSTFNGGSLDDITIIDSCLYRDSFVPPTLYIGTEDTIENYYRLDESNIVNNNQLEEETQDLIDHKMESTAYLLNEAQRGYLPQRVRITWFEDREYFINRDIERVSKYRNYTVIKINNIHENDLGFKNSEFNEGLAYHLLLDKKIDGFMIFINGEFIPLSKIQIIKSDEYYTLIIKNRDPNIKGKVTKVEFVRLPFPIIYEELIGERPDNVPIYKFNINGKFDSGQNAIYFYYIDKESPLNCNLMTNGIYEQNLPLNFKESTLSDSNVLKHSWRYGQFEEKRIVDDTTVQMYFRSWDHSYLSPDDTIILYNNGVPVDPDSYKIIGDDLIEFLDYNTIDGIYDNLFSMDILTFDVNQADDEFISTTLFKFVSKQDGTISIPISKNIDISDNYQIIASFFIGDKFIPHDHYYIDTKSNSVILVNPKDVVNAGEIALIYFVKVLKSSQYGKIHIKPIQNKITIEEDTPSITLPNDMNYDLTNFTVYVDQKQLLPRDYIIESNKLILFDKNATFKKDQTITIMIYKFVDEYEDPRTTRYEVIKNQLSTGRRFILYDLNIDKRYKITLDNIVAFDQNGTYTPDLFGQIYNRNIIKSIYTGDPLERFPSYISCIWLKDSLSNEANTIHPTSKWFINGYIGLYEEFYEMDEKFQEFMDDFNVRYYKDKHYGENLAKALDYMACYQQMKFDPIYEKRATAYRESYNVLKLNKAVHLNDSGRYQYDMERDDFHDRYYRTYPIYFLNGSLPEWYEDIIYDGNKVSLQLEYPFKGGDIDSTFTNTKTIEVPIPFNFSDATGIDGEENIYIKEVGKQTQFNTNYSGSCLVDISDCYTPSSKETLGRTTIDFSYDCRINPSSDIKYINLITVYTNLGEPLCNVYTGDEAEYKKDLSTITKTNNYPMISFSLNSIAEKDNFRLAISYSNDTYNISLFRNGRRIKTDISAMPYYNIIAYSHGTNFNTTNANTDDIIFKYSKLLNDINIDKTIANGYYFHIKSRSSFMYGSYIKSSITDRLEAIKCKNIVNFLQPLNSKILYINRVTREFIFNLTVGTKEDNSFTSTLTVPTKTREYNIKSSITVISRLIVYKNAYEITFPAEITVSVPWKPTDINGFVRLYVWDYVDINDTSGESFEIYSRVTPSYGFDAKEFACKLEVPIVIPKS